MRLTKKPSSFKKYPPSSFMYKVRKRRIIETFIAFVAGGVAAVEFVYHIIFHYYHFPRYTVDITIIAIMIAMLCTIAWRWFRGEKGEETEEPKAEPISFPEWKNSIVVLPFDNISPEKEQEYFCDGLTEEIISALSHIKDLRVVARTSAFAFKGKEIDIREVGKKLSVGTVLEGSVRKAGDRLRITAQLVNVADGYHLWSERFDRKLKDVFDIQDEISLAIVDKLKVKILGQEKVAILKRHTEDKEAYNLYLKGRHYLMMMTVEGFEKAIESFEQAIQKDPNFALPFAGLGLTYVMGSYWGGTSPHEAYPRAREYTKKALETDSSLAEAHSLSGYISTLYDWNWEAAEREFRQALKLNPNSPEIHRGYSFLLTITRRHKEAIAEAKRAQELDPLSSDINSHVGGAFHFAGRFDEAIETLEMTLSMNPGFFHARYMLGLAYTGKSMIEKAMVEYEKAVELSGGNPWSMMTLATTCYRLGKKVRAEKLIKKLVDRSKREYIPPMCFYYIHKVRGELNQAAKWLKKACEERDSFLPWSIVTPVARHQIPDDPRFTEVLKKAGLIT